MTQLVSGVELSHLSKNTAQISKNDLPTAKKQAYILTDLIKKICHVKLSGSDVTNLFSCLYYGKDWPALNKSVCPDSQDDYYCVEAAGLSSLLLQCKYLQKLCPALKGQNIGGALLSMPMRQYHEARTMEGARIASLLAGKATWELVGNGRVYDANKDSEVFVKCFSSCPETNKERLMVLDGGEPYLLSLEDVRFVCLHKENKPKHELYTLADHVNNDELTKRLYKNATNLETASMWYGHGGRVRLIEIKHSRIANMIVEDSKSGLNFREQVQFLREKNCSNIVVIPVLGEIQDPTNKYTPEYKELRKHLSAVEKAEIEYKALLKKDVPAVDALSYLEGIADGFNLKLKLAYEAYCKDRKLDLTKADMEYYLPHRPGDLYFSNSSPYGAIKRIIGQ